MHSARRGVGFQLIDISAHTKSRYACSAPCARFHYYYSFIMFNRYVWECSSYKSIKAELEALLSPWIPLEHTIITENASTRTFGSEFIQTTSNLRCYISWLEFRLSSGAIDRYRRSSPAICNLMFSSCHI